MSVSDAVPKGRRATLEALADLLADRLDRCPVDFTSPIAGRLQSVLAELDAIPDTAEVTALDELKAKRSTRRKRATNSKRATEGEQRGAGRRAAGGAGGVES